MQLEAGIQDSHPIALLVAFDNETVEACLRLLGEEVRLLVADSEAEARRLLTGHPVAVLALGSGVSGERARKLLEDAEALPDSSRRLNLVQAAGPDPTRFQELIDLDRIFYLSQEPGPAGDLIALLRSAAARWRAGGRQEDEGERRRASSTRRLLAASQAIAAQQQPPGLTRAAAEGVEDVAAADRGYCLLYDAASETLWEPARREDEEQRRESAAVGMVSFVVRTGQPLSVERIAGDPRFDREADDPPAQGDERFAAVPVLGLDGRVLAVLAAVRAADRPPFSGEDLRDLALLAEQAAPSFARLGLADAAADALPAAALFREEAVEHHQIGLRSEGDLLRVDPGWMRWTYRLLLTALAAGLLFTLLARVREYAAGPAVVRLGGRVDLTATGEGTVTQVDVASGQRVAPGQLLVRFYGAREAAELARLDGEFELQLISRLRDPADTGAERALLSLRAERELARARLAERELRAPAAGVVSDVHVRPGQHIGPGQSLVSLARGQQRPEVIAFVPGEYRPLLKPGMPLRLEIQGYRYAYQHLVVDSVGDEVVGPAEAQRYLGAEIADAVQFGGPVVRVSGRLASDTFEAEGRRRRYHDGMLARAEVRVRSERVLVALVPALKAIFEPLEGGDA